MNFKKLALIVALCLLGVAGSLIFIRDHVIEKTEFIPDLTDLTKNYMAEDEIKAAIEVRKAADIKPVEVITNLLDGTPRIALIFDGMPERPMVAKLLDVLKKHHAEAVFFLEGENVADEPEVIKLIRAEGQEVGNYTYVGLSALEKRTADEQIREICRTQKVITMHDSLAPTLFRAPHTVFTDDLLKSVRASGLEYAVKENVRYNPGNIQNQAQANAYAASVRNGSIIAIPTNRPVEQKASAPVVLDEKPAVDMKPTIKDNNAAVLPPKEDLSVELDMVLTAFDARGVKAVFVNQFRKIHYIPAGLTVKNPGK